MRGKDGKLGFRGKDRKIMKKKHMEEITNKENNWDHITGASMVEEPIEKVTHEKMAIAITAMKPGKAARPPEVCAEMMSTSGEVGLVS